MTSTDELVQSRQREQWVDTLRVVLIAWGVALLAAGASAATPVKLVRYARLSLFFAIV